MRVLHVYSGNLYGGIESMLVTLSRCRDLCVEMKPEFALCFDGRLSEELIDAGAPLHKLGHVRARQLGSILRARRKLRELLGRASFDVVICHAPWSLAIFGPVVRRAKIPLAFWLHGPVDGRHWSERWARRTLPDLVLCNSHFTAQSVPRIFPQSRSEVIYCPVAFPQVNYSRDERMATRAELNTPEDTVVIIQVSRMEAWKGHALHLEALNLLSDVPNWSCWQVGGAQSPDEVLYFEKMKSTASRLDIASRVQFLGERQDVRRLLAAANIFCQPNTGAEPFGITLIEALFAGLPVVTTAIGGALEIIDESCGVLVPPGDARDFARSLRLLIENSDLRMRLAHSGSAHATELCEPKRQLRRLNDSLADVIHRRIAA